MQRRETETQKRAVRCPWPSDCTDPELEPGLIVFPTTPAFHIVLGMAGRGVMVVGGGGLWGDELTGSCLPKLCGGRSILQDQGLWPGNICFPSNQRGDFCLPRMPKSRGGWGRAGVGLETSNAFSRPLGDLVLTWASEPLSLLLPPVRSMRSSHRQLMSWFHSLTPAVTGFRGSWMGPTTASFPPPFL